LGCRIQIKDLTPITAPKKAVDLSPLAELGGKRRGELLFGSYYRHEFWSLQRPGINSFRLVAITRQFLRWRLCYGLKRKAPPGIKGVSWALDQSALEKRRMMEWKVLVAGLKSSMFPAGLNPYGLEKAVCPVGPPSINSFLDHRSYYDTRISLPFGKAPERPSTCLRRQTHRLHVLS